MNHAEANQMRQAFAGLGATELVVRPQWYTSHLAPWNQDEEGRLIERDYSGSFELVGLLADGRRLHCETLGFARRCLQSIVNAQRV